MNKFQRLKKHPLFLLAGPLFLFASGLLNAQSDSVYLRVSIQTGIYEDMQSELFSLGFKTARVVFPAWLPPGPVLGVAWPAAPNIYQEVELAELYWYKTKPESAIGPAGALSNEDFDAKRFRLRMRHGLEFHLRRYPEKRAWMALGGGYNVYYRSLDIRPRLTSLSRETQKRGGLTLDIKLTAYRQIGRRLRLEGGAGLAFGGMSLAHYRTYDPNLPEEQQKTQSFEFSVGPEALLLRMGVVYSMGSSLRSE